MLSLKLFSIKNFAFVFTLGLLAACEMPVSQVASKASSEAPYVQGPEPGPVNDDELPPWDLPYDRGNNPYVRNIDTYNVVNKAKAVDVLFVMDNSASMSEEQNGVVDSFAKFLEGFTNERIDYHIGVVATDTRPTAAGAGWTDRAYTQFPNIGSGSLLAYAGNPRFISAENGRSAALNQFRRNALLGTYGDGAETGLLAAIHALSPTMLNGWNSSFLRSDSLLSIVIVSDEDENFSTNTFGGNRYHYIKRNPDAEASRINAFVDRVKTLRPNRPDLVRLDIVIAPSQAECPTVGSDTKGLMGVGETYIKAHAKIYEGVTNPSGKILNICRDFSAELGDLGSQIAVQVERRFKLSKKVEGELIVKLNGRRLEASSREGFAYNQTLGEIELRGLDLENLNEYSVQIEYIGLK